MEVCYLVLSHQSSSNQSHVGEGSTFYGLPLYVFSDVLFFLVISKCELIFNNLRNVWFHTYIYTKDI